jgi:putative Mg2+ transporter-C (MgtC) family protein
MIGAGDVLLRLSVAAVFGLAVGVERERRARAAGMRTMALVGLGAALFTLISAYAFNDLIVKQHLQIDPTRIMAQIVSGIGFLGAGVIWLRKDMVRGLTSAAALWVVAAVGMACGAGLWVFALIGIAAALVVLALLRPVERLIFPEHGLHVLRVWVGSMAEAGPLITRVYEACARAGVSVETLGVHPSKREHEVIEVRCRIKNAGQLARAMEGLRGLPGVQAVRADVRGLRLAGKPVK